MERPYIISHMMMSLDGRIDCPVMAQISGEEYYTALDSLGKCSKLTGRTTAALECTAVGGENSNPELLSFSRESFHIARQSDQYTIVMDTKRSLQWCAAHADGYPVLCICSGNVSDSYLADMRSKGISWVAAGEGKIDLARAMEMLYQEFGIAKVAIVGGGYINGGFLDAGLIDEVSMMIAAGIDGRKGETSVFDGIPHDRHPYRLRLNGLDRCTGTDTIWARYAVIRK